MILVVAGEPSGDRLIGEVLRARGERAIGIGGDAIGAAGGELVAHVADLGAMGTTDVARGGLAIGIALARLARVVRKVRPRRAILASWSTANGRLAPLLRARGIDVTWIGPPEVWAWRASRAPRLARAVDRMIVLLPFEETIWRDAGADAHFLGHPAIDALVDRDAVRARLGLRAPAVAVMPGSRRAEIERLLPSFLEAARGFDARILVAPSLPRSLREAVRAAGPSVDVDPRTGATALLSGFDAALVASGTASLEAAIAGAPPVIAYRLDPLSHALARRLVRSPHVGLPNVVLARAGQAPVFEEILQDVSPSRLRAALERTLGDPPRAAACAAVAAAFGADHGDATWSARVAAKIG